MADMRHTGSAVKVPFQYSNEDWYSYDDYDLFGIHMITIKVWPMLGLHMIRKNVP